ncbi:carbamoyltransferase HypF [Photobacterium sp. GJ3]|uniref:carbamoyltransferase HypF n=1 Tax=Photobacterium sp. GJ3 TaxID=2829502 RepID=UPI001B8DA3C8|nr:carbamoyltransferase HypF [Photobacterium sp. GJ3]QUJ66592.1 carbamoyltransferase HypF [Photobacterium sp. GJ3]
MKQMQTFRVNGVVQGVGFRPFVHKLALKHDLNGWVINDSQGVRLGVQGTLGALDSFISELKLNPPPLALITEIILEDISAPDPACEGFVVLASDNKDEVRTIVPPDSYVCDECLQEMRDIHNRRYQYPFINCTNCGPRYSLIKGMPYDRPQTSMAEFNMCGPCLNEYQDINDRRYHAQPNACPNCGPALSYFDHQGNQLTGNPLTLTRDHLAQGKILAIKSVGGFHLAVDAHNPEAVERLRRRKKRDSKAFALMVQNPESIAQIAEINEVEENLLTSPQSPIVLLKAKKGRLPDNIAPNNPNLGIMLPSAPLHHLLFDDQRLEVLVMTSANTSGEPTIYQNEKALTELTHIADYFLLNDRDIVTRNDDSLLYLSNSHGHHIASFIRRSRGYAPFPINVKSEVKSILAVGAELKTTLALSKERDVYLSQHIGDVKNEQTFDSLLECSNKMQQLLDIRPEAIAVDLHPNFITHQYFKRNATIPVITVQHHHAHMASCMAENQLDTPVIGAIFDGTGYGTDGTIWGGEFFLGDYHAFERKGHLMPFSLIGGDKAVKEPKRVAIALLYQAFGNEAKDLPESLFSHLSADEKNVFFTMAERQINSFTTTSMGRFFDGVSSLLKVCHQISYEAQAAIELEALLEKDLHPETPLNYDIIEQDGLLILDHRPIIRHLVDLILSGTSAALISRRFHCTIAEATVAICHQIAQASKIEDVVLSGGVFMNEFLLSNTIASLSDTGLKPYNQTLVPANDGGIALGQLMIANATLNPDVGEK